MIDKILNYFQEEFGIAKDVFLKYEFIIHNKNVYIMTKEAKEFEGERVVRKGIRLARITRSGIKPTTDAVQLFGPYATKNKIELSQKEEEDFIKGQSLSISASQKDGYKIVFYKNYPLGIGLYRAGKLKSQIPRAKRIL